MPNTCFHRWAWHPVLSGHVHTVVVAPSARHRSLRPLWSPKGGHVRGTHPVRGLAPGAASPLCGQMAWAGSHSCLSSPRGHCQHDFHVAPLYLESISGINCLVCFFIAKWGFIAWMQPGSSLPHWSDLVCFHALVPSGWVSVDIPRPVFTGSRRIRGNSEDCGHPVCLRPTSRRSCQGT